MYIHGVSVCIVCSVSQPVASAVVNHSSPVSSLASERSERACSCSIEISDTYIYVCGRTSSYMHMLNSSLLGNEKLRGPMVRHVGGVKFQPLSKA